MVDYGVTKCLSIKHLMLKNFCEKKSAKRLTVTDAKGTNVSICQRGEIR